jgi:hypothetical protein
MEVTEAGVEGNRLEVIAKASCRHTDLALLPKDLFSPNQAHLYRREIVSLFSPLKKAINLVSISHRRIRSAF